MATLSAPAGYTSSNLVFQESFSGTALDSVWHPYITSNAANGWPWNDNGAGGSGPGGIYDADYDMASQVTVSDGLLNLTAIKQSIYGVNQGTWETYPITSGAVSSYGGFEFNGGYLQISMKAPSGDGAWPGLWLLPGQGAGSSGDNFEIDIQEGGYTGSGPANQAFSYHLHTPTGTFGGVVDTGVDLTAAFHTYGINWIPGESITWYLDGKQIATVTSAQAQIPNEPMELILSNQVADSDATGWHTVLNSSTPASMQMQVDEIQLYQLAGHGETVTGANVTPTTNTAPTTPTIQPAVTTVSASPATGIEHVGDTVTLTLGFNEAVTVTGTPTLSLNDGDTATYIGGSGTNSLVFRTTVASTDTSTSALGITGVNLPSGASIKDASGVVADLSGAVKTFSGLQIDPTSPVTTDPVTPTPVTPEPSTAPTLSIADNTLWVAGRGGTVDLGVGVTTTDSNDAVTVNIKGLPKYETITDNLDGHTYRGKNITLTAAQVESGLTLQSNYRGSDEPVATLTVTATGKDPVTGAVTTSAPQTITVTDPVPVTAPTAASLANQGFALLSQYLAGGHGQVDPGQIVAAVSQAPIWQGESFLTRPQH
jgi:beta-glucanase (GH16 family)